MIVRNTKPHDITPTRRLVNQVFDDQHVALVDALRKSGAAVFDYVAEAGGAIVGHAVCSKMQSPERCLGLGPVGVSPERRGKGIGTALVRAIIAEARKDGWLAIFVLGAPAYYARFGFSVERAASFATHYTKAHFMILDLQNGASEQLPRTATYAQPFIDFGN